MTSSSYFFYKYDYRVTTDLFTSKEKLFALMAVVSQPSRAEGKRGENVLIIFPVAHGSLRKFYPELPCLYRTQFS